MRAVLHFARSDVGNRLKRVFSAQLFNQVTTIAVQLLLVPVLLRAWGKETYGIWLLLSAVPSYLTFSDLGFTQMAKNEMLMLVSAGRRDEAIGVFHSVFAMLNVVMPVIVIVSLALTFGLDLSRLLKLGDFPLDEARAVIAILLVNVLVYQYFLLISGGIRCENRLATEASWGATARLTEGVCVGAAALLGGGIMLAAVVTLANRLVMSLGLYAWLRRTSSWLWLGHSRARRSEVKRMLQPAFAFMLLPISQALLIQGPVLIIGAVIGPVAVVTFATTRTLTRLGTAATNMLNGTVQGEYSTAYARVDRSGLKRIFRYHQLITLLMIAGYAVVLLLLKDPVMALYTHGQVTAPQPFFGLMLATIAIEMLWSATATFFQSVNRHILLAYISIAICVVGMGLVYLTTRMWGISGAAGAMAVIHFAILIACYGLWRNLADRRQAVAYG